MVDSAVADRRLRARSTEWATVLAAAAVTLIGVWQEVSHSPYSEPPTTLAYLIGLVAAVPLIWRRRWPVAVALASFAAAACYHFAGYSGGAPVMATIVAVFTVAAAGDGTRLGESRLPASVLSRSPSRSVVIAICIGATAALLPTLPPRALAFANGAVYAPLFGLVVIALVGDTSRARNAEMAGRLARSDELRRVEVHSRVFAERLAIARELHDVVAHTVAVITVQAGVAADLFEAHPSDARAAILAIRRAAVEANRELRATVSVLRSTTSDPALAPTPGLQDIHDLVAGAGGLKIQVSLRGTDRQVSKSVDLAGYRIIQEALTNVARHSEVSEATLDIEYGEEAVEITIADRGVGILPTLSSERGFGLIGMGERASAAGGTLKAGPRTGGGFQVFARLPREHEQ